MSAVMGNIERDPKRNAERQAAQNEAVGIARRPHEPDGVYFARAMWHYKAEADQLTGAVEERDALREAVWAFLNGARLDEHGRFKDARLEALYRAAGGQ